MTPDKTKPTLILLHGFRGTHHGLAKIAENLADFELVIPDLPGFGEGPTFDNYSIETYVDWLHELITQYDHPHLLGHSFGSIVAAAYAAHYSDTIQKLILVNPIGAPALEGPRGALTKLAIFYYQVGKVLPAGAAKAWLSSKPSTLIMSKAMTKTKDRALQEYIDSQHLQHFSSFHSADSVHQGFVTSVSNSVRDYAAQIDAQTLLIAGEKDDITSIEKQRELVGLFHNAQLVEIPNVGHLTHYETPKEVAAAVQAFIKSE
jgi:pimeloyl-ACP methyl ester carboxylesterase